MKLNLTMLLRIMLEESFDITLVRMMSMVLMLTRFLCWESILKLRTNLKMYLRKLFFLSFGPECPGPIYLSKMLLDYSTDLDEFLLVVEISKNRINPSCCSPFPRALMHHLSRVRSAQAEPLYSVWNRDWGPSPCWQQLGVHSWRLRCSAIQDNCKVLVLVRFILLYYPGVPWLRIPKKQVLKKNWIGPFIDKQSILYTDSKFR